jgi:hypothetical protein
MTWLVLALFTASLALPALSIQIFGDPGLLWGWVAFTWTFAAIPDVFRELAAGSFAGELLESLIFPVGVLANIFLIFSFAHFAANSWRNKSLKIPRRLAMSAAAFMLADLALLLSTGDIHAIYPGYGCWLASPIALALASRD